jgi:UDP-N-acetylmuramyl tripeptide synthase
MQVLETLTYIGRNRRSDVCVIETLLELSTGEQEALSVQATDYCRRLNAVLQTVDIQVETSILSNGNKAADAAGFFAFLYARTALVIQQAAGHRVSFLTTVNDPNPNRKRAVFEYEHEDVGHRADMLALKLLTSVIPELNWIDCPFERTGDFTELFVEFKESARPFILPVDTQAIIDAAVRLEVPCVKLERAPYQGLSGDFRIRNNSLLKLGHSVYQHIVDGTFCIDKAEHLLPLLRDREKLFQVLTQMQVPVALQDNEFRSCMNAKDAARSAIAIGFPVVVKPWLRSGQGISLNIPDVEALQIAVKKAQQHNQKVMVEKHIEGETFKIIVVNGVLIGAVFGKNGEDVSNDIHPSTLNLILNLARQSGVGMLVADVVSTEISSPLQQHTGAIVDVNFAPELDRFLPVGSELHQRAMLKFVQWLYPQGARSRIPTVAITGTNGKTTTSRMITNIMQTGHFHTGLACTDGIYINEKLNEAGDLSGRGGHHRVFESREVDMGILETARGALAHSGFMFDWCNVSVCLNVTEDHLGEYGIETVEQMAELKRSVLESARDGVVLNADDERCISMLPFLLTRRICLVSLQSGVEQLRELADQGNACFCVLESEECYEWLVFYDGNERIPLMRVNQIPATFDGTARFNVSNAMHAFAASYLLGTGIKSIRAALSNFSAGHELTPGRMNVFDGLPFRVIMDFAHNPDGLQKICEFADRQNVSGRKLIAFSGLSKRSDEQNRKSARAVAGHFDYYFCKDIEPSKPPKRRFTGPFMQQVLTEEGVPGHTTTVLTYGRDAIFRILDNCEPGDLLILLVGRFETRKVPGYIQEYREKKQWHIP